ncbi:MAG: beta-propeller domain-containing protein, partial [Acetanaerobacterium sp.]
MARYQPEQDIVFLRGKFEELEAELVPSHRISPEVLLNKLENETPQLAVKRVFLTHKRLALALCAGFVCCIALMYAGTQRGRLFTAGSAVSPENSGLSIMERMAQEQPQQADQSEAFAKDVDYAGVRKALSAVSVDSSDYDMPTVSAEETTGGGGPETDGSSLQGNSGVLTAARTDTGGADIIETDGSYLYYATGPSVMIAGIAQDGAITFSSEIKVSGEDRYVIELYQRGNSLTLLCNDYSFTVAKADENTGKTAQVQSVGTTVETYDVTDRSNPVRVREFTQEGEYRSSLVSEDTLYIVSERKTFAYADVLPVDAIVPSVYDSAAGGEKGGAKLISSTDIVLRDEPKSSGYVTVSALALDDDTATVRTRAVLGGAQEIYCAKSGVYLLD